MHFWKAIKTLREFPDKVKQTVVKVFAGNAYFAHREHLLGAMLVDTRKNIRELAVRRIQNARERVTKEIRILKYLV